MFARVVCENDVCESDGNLREWFVRMMFAKVICNSNDVARVVCESDVCENDVCDNDVCEIDVCESDVCESGL